MKNPDEKRRPFHKLLIFLGVVVFVSLFSPLKNFKWGKVEQLNPQTITVSGIAKSQEVSQIANFSAGVEITNTNKDQAVDEVGAKMTQIIKDVKKFGIEEKNIKTQRVNVYEYEESERGRSTGEIKWTASNRISIRLDDVDKAGELMDLLSASGATNVSGPNFTIDDTEDIDIVLLEKAIENAREKAKRLAKASGRTLGDVYNVVEGGSADSYQSIGLLETKSVGMPMEPGSQDVSKSVTVTFELK